MVADGGGRPRGRRGGARRWLPLIAAVWAIAEIWVMVLVAQATSGLAVIALLAAGLAVGAALVQRAGLRALRGVMRAAEPGGGAPGAPGVPADGARGKAAANGRGRNGAVATAGAFFMIPGFLTDVLALAVLFPPTGRLLTSAARRLLGRNPAVRQFRIRRPDGKVVPGEVVDPGAPFDYRNPPQGPRRDAPRLER